MTMTQSTSSTACCSARRHHFSPQVGPANRRPTTQASRQASSDHQRGASDLCTRQTSPDQTRSSSSTTRPISEQMQLELIHNLLNKQKNKTSTYGRTASSSTGISLLAIVCCCLFSLILVKLSHADHLPDVAQLQQQHQPHRIPPQPISHNPLESSRQDPFGGLLHRPSRRQQQELLLQLGHVLSQQRQQQKQHQQQVASPVVRHHREDSPTLLHHYTQWNQQHHQGPQQSLHQAHSEGQHWTSSSASAGDGSLAGNHEAGQVQETTPMQHSASDYVSYRQPAMTTATGNHQAPTTPSLNKQLVPPPPFYELGLAPTNAIQLESSSSSQEEPTSYASSLHDHHQHQMMASDSIQHPVVIAAPSTSANNMTSNLQQQQHQQAPAGLQMMSARQARQQNNNDISHETSNKDPGAEQTSSSQLDQPVDKSIEPRQRRRLFNRILKKVDWNTVLVELSRVLLKTILDSALKDIIGKQSGGVGSTGTGSGSGDSTTSRKKLDAQSELTDLLRDFITKAISSTFNQ